MLMSLNYDDIHQLIKEPSAKMRSNIAQKVASGYGSSSFTPKSNKIALDILRLLLKDTEKQVRLVLAQELKHNNAAPHDVILSLAYDCAEIAEEVLQYSKVLQDSDLIELIEIENDLRKMVAITKREKVSKIISRKLVASNKSPVIISLLANSGAEIDEVSYNMIIDEFAHDFSIVESLVCRGRLSFVLAEKLYYLVSEKFKKNITKRHLIPVKVAEKITTDARENMILKFLSPWMTDDDLIILVEQMYNRKRLSDGLILRALCHGELRFFEAAVAKRVGIPIANARKLLKDNDIGFGAVYRSCRLPAEYSDAVKAILKLVQQEISLNNNRLSEDFNEQIMQKIISYKYDVNIQNMHELMNEL